MKTYDKYKDSGIEWIGDIPEHWTIEKGKRLFNFVNGYPFDSKKFSNVIEGLPIVRIRDIQKHSSKTYWQGEIVKEAIIDTNDILIGMDGDFNISIWKGGTALLNQRVCKIYGVKKYDDKFLFYLLPFSLKVINDLITQLLNICLIMIFGMRIFLIRHFPNKPPLPII
ncbi:MAG: restriction endonuclease subunit S [Aridibacter sp.]